MIYVFLLIVCVFVELVGIKIEVSDIFVVVCILVEFFDYLIEE